MNIHICRCCLRENSTCTYAIYDGATTVEAAVGGDDLRTALLSCAPKLHLDPEDGLPDIICEQCMLSLRDALAFRRRCEESELELQRRHADTERAIEEALHLVNLIDSSKEQRHARDTAGTAAADELGPSELALLDELLQLEESNVERALQTSRADVSQDVCQSSKEGKHKTVKDSAPKADKKSKKPRATTNTRTPHKQRGRINSPVNYDSSTTNTEDSGTSSSSSSSSAAACKKRRRCNTPKSLHPCPECEKKFTRNFQLKLHMISVHKLGGEGGLYECNECHKTFASRHSLTYHQRSVHSDERPFECAHCQRRFVLRTQLSSHMRIHTGEAKPRNLQCLECGKRWPTKSDLRTHMRSHEKAQERPFKCEQCEKAFFTRGHLSSHLLVHSGEKPFACATCGKSYQCVGNLNNHMARQHDFERGTAARARSVILEIAEM